MREDAPITRWPVISGILCLLILVLASSLPAQAQLKDLLDGIFGKNDDHKAEEARGGGVSDEPAGAAIPCPKTVSFFKARSLYPEACGKVKRPDIPGAPTGALLAMEGVWEIELRGTPDGTLTWVAALSKGLNEVGVRQPNADWALIGNTVGPIDAVKLPFIGRTFSEAPQVRPGAVKISMHGYDILVKGSPRLMRGRWRRGKETGLTVWRKRAPYRVASIAFDSNWHRKDGSGVVDTIAPGSRPAKLEMGHPVTCGYGAMRGNCPRVYVRIMGERLGAPHEIWLDPASHMELLERSFLLSAGGGLDSAGRMTAIVSGRNAVAGIQLQFAMWDGARPGPQVLWFDGRPIPFELVIHGYPEQEPTPEMTSLVAIGRDGKELSELVEGREFRLVATFDKPHHAPWISVDMPGEQERLRVDAPLGEDKPPVPQLSRDMRKAVLWRQPDNLRFASRPLKILPPPRATSTR